jgi:hypothetical protein
MVLEVIDKAATPGQLWVASAFASVIAFVTCRRWPRALYFFIPAGLFYTWGVVALYRDPDVGPAVWREGGWPYAAHMVLSTLLVLVAPIIGYRLRRRTQQTGLASTSDSDGAVTREH